MTLTLTAFSDIKIHEASLEDFLLLSLTYFRHYYLETGTMR